MKTSNSGIELIKRSEGFRPTVYKDIAGLRTIGYGHLMLPTDKMERLTQEEGIVLLQKDLGNAEGCVNRLVIVEINQNQFDALVSFVFNLGCGAFSKSTLLRKINEGKNVDAAKEFLKWVYAGGKKSAGLLNRRIEESKLFSMEQK